MAGWHDGSRAAMRQGRPFRLTGRWSSGPDTGRMARGSLAWWLLARALGLGLRPAPQWVGLVILMLCMAAGGAVAAGQTGRPLTVEDIVALESFGRASIAPNERWAVYERRGGYDTAPRYDLGARSTWTIMKLRRLDLGRAGSRSEPLLEGDPSGLLCGPWSPSGRRLVICRLIGETLELGIVDVASRGVRWTGLTPELPMAGATMEWVGEDRLVLMSRPDRSLPWLLRFSSGSQARATEDWARSAAGARPSRAVLNTADGVLSSRARPADQSLVLMDVPTGRLQTLASGQISDFSVSPDGSWLAIVENGEPVAVQPGSVSFSGVRHRQRLSLLGLKGQAPVRFDAQSDIGPGLLRWSPSSHALLAWIRRDGEAWDQGRLARLENDGTVTLLDHTGLAPIDPDRGLGFLAGVRADWFGSTPVLYARDGDRPRQDWYALAPDRQPLAITAQMQVPPSRLNSVTENGGFLVGDGGVWFSDAAGTQRLTPEGTVYRDILIGDTETPFRLRINSAPRRLSAQVQSAEGSVVSVQGNGEVLAVGRDGSADQRILAVSAGTSLALRANGVVEDLVLSTQQGDRSVDQVNADLAEVVRIRPRPVSHMDSKGRPVVSQLFAPAGRRLADARGVIVLVYPGSVSTGAWQGPFYLTYGLRAEVLAGAGYAVLSPAIPHEPSHSPSPETLTEGVDLAVDAMLEQYPDLAAGRMAVAGHSFGGGTALLVATRSDRYQAYIAWAGFSDLFGQWGEFSPVSRQVPEEEPLINRTQAWVETGQARMGGPPWARPDAYVAFSPFMAADRIRAPVLLIAGDRDFVPVTQAERMFSALYRLGGHSRLITYWGEDHFNWSPANIRDVYSQILEWLDQVLEARVRPEQKTSDARLNGSGARADW